jgi:hypothetical protein
MLRVWAVITMVWLAGWAVYVGHGCDYIRTPVQDKVYSLYLMCPTSLFDDFMVRPRYFGFREYAQLIGTGFGPPLAALLLGMGTRWAVRGFLEKRVPSN